MEPRGVNIHFRIRRETVTGLGAIGTRICIEYSDRSTRSENRKLFGNGGKCSENVSGTYEWWWMVTGDQVQ